MLAVLASTVKAGEEYARERSLSDYLVITPRSLSRARGWAFDSFISVGDFPITRRDAGVLLFSFPSQKVREDLARSLGLGCP